MPRETYLFVIGHYGAMGGAERQALHFIRYLRENRDCAIATLGWYDDGPLGQTLREMGCATYNFPYLPRARKFRKAVNLARMASFIRREIRPDYILPFVSIHSKPICQIWRFTGARYAWWNQQDEGRGLFGSTAERKALLNASHITSNSLAGTEFLATTYGIPQERIITYNNGTVVPDVAKLVPVWRQRLGLAEGTKLVSMAANITPFKDHETLLKAWRIVVAEFARASRPLPILALAGYTSQTGHVTRMKALAFDLGLGSTLSFLGPIDTTDELMYESDLVAHSSVKEGCPNSVCEAMALGKPVVGTDIPGIRQAVPERFWENCLAEPFNAEELAAKMLGLLGNGELAGDIGRVNRQRIIDEFSIRGMCEFFESLIEEGRRR